MTAAACPGMDRGAPGRLSSAIRMSPFLWAALLSLCPATAVQESTPDETPSCPKDLSIRGGTFSLSDGYRSGSILAYSCPPGTYPYPTRSRICQSDGKWTPMFSSSGTRTNVAQCRVVRCPPQRAFEHGSFSPRRSAHPVGDILSFECFDGYQLLGSSQRHCLPNGRWNGTSPVCDDGVGHCRSLAIPPGAIVSGVRNQLGDRVSFQCQNGLDLVGSAQRVCTPEGEWSGAEVSCRAPYSYDEAEDVRAEFGASFTNVLTEVSSSGPDPSGSSQAPNLGRRLILTKDGFLYLYLLVDASHSVTEANFDIFKECLQIIINRIASFDVPIKFAIISYASQPKIIVDILDDIAEDPELVLDQIKKMRYRVQDNFRSLFLFTFCLSCGASLCSSSSQIASFDVPIKFAIISYASQPKIIVDILDDIAEDPELVLEQIKKMRYRDHGNATGTNIHAALDAVYKMMISDRASFSEQWDKVRHAVILFTDGRSRLEEPKSINKENSIAILPPFADHGNATGTNIHAALDAVYKMMISDRASFSEQWDKVRHAVILFTDGKSNMKGSPKMAVKQIEDLVNVRENRTDYLDPRDLDDICGLANYSDSARRDQKNPWHGMLQDNHQAEPPCRGALISKTWVLTSAHCFNTINNISSWTVILGGGESRVPIKRRIDHELYNVRAKVGQGIKEFYDYDISLLELKSPVQFGGRIRPICLPCTEGANRALKRKSGATTCKDHELELLSFEKVPAQFISLDYKRMNVEIKTKTSRPLCISGAKQEDMLYSQVSDVSEVVTDRFLCSGQDSAVEAATCKGESGGSLFVERRERYFQVGVISWGTYDPCKIKKKDWNTEEIKRARPPPNHRPRDFYINIFAVQDWLRQHLSGSLRFIPL
nr:complement C2 [Pogona vitticeps]